MSSHFVTDVKVSSKSFELAYRHDSVNTWYVSFR